MLRAYLRVATAVHTKTALNKNTLTVQATPPSGASSVTNPSGPCRRRQPQQRKRARFGGCCYKIPRRRPARSPTLVVDAPPQRYPGPGRW